MNNCRIKSTYKDNKSKALWLIADMNEISRSTQFSIDEKGELIKYMTAQVAILGFNLDMVIPKSPDDYIFFQMMVKSESSESENLTN